LFLTESGLEYESRRMAQNVDWYRSSHRPHAVLGGDIFRQRNVHHVVHPVGDQAAARLLSTASGAGASICV